MKYRLTKKAKDLKIFDYIPVGIHNDRLMMVIDVENYPDLFEPVSEKKPELEMMKEDIKDIHFNRHNHIATTLIKKWTLRRANVDAGKFYDEWLNNKSGESFINFSCKNFDIYRKVEK